MREIARRARPTVRGRLVRVSALAPQMHESMWCLFRSYYKNTTRQEFDSDLHEKSDVILLFDSTDGSLQGFSTLLVCDRVVQGRTVSLVFSGDTIVAKRYWGQTALQRTFLRYIMRAKLLRPWRPVFWFLISKGYRTYLLLSRNFPEYWPRHDKVTPEWQQAILEDFATFKFGTAWHAASGTLRFDPPRAHLRPQVAPISADELAFADIRFFSARNAHYQRGDELCCLGRVDFRLWVSYMLKLIRRSTRRGLQSRLHLDSVQPTRAIASSSQTPSLASNKPHPCKSPKAA